MNTGPRFFARDLATVSTPDLLYRASNIPTRLWLATPILLILILQFSLSIVVSTSAWGADDDALYSLAQTYAPQLMHPHDEPNLPTNVDWFLPKTRLSFVNKSCPQDNKALGTPTLDLLEVAQVVSACGGHTFKASGTRSANRSKTFVLEDVPKEYRAGSSDPADWTTYYHAYKNSKGGWTLQYWTFYPFNTGKKILGAEVGYHGGDWEMVSVVLGSDSQPIQLDMTGHDDMVSAPWNMVTKVAGNHPVVFTEKGGHEVHIDPQEPPPYIIHPTWKDSLVELPGGVPLPNGPLVDLGTKLAPKVKFLSYSGLWGSLGAFFSGYWGPAFNETGMPANGFLRAWCDGVADPNETNNTQRECYPDDPQ